MVSDPGMVDLDGQITTVVESSELADSNGPLLRGSCLDYYKYHWDWGTEALLRLVFGDAVAAGALSGLTILI